MVNNVALVDFQWEAEGTIAMTLAFLSWLDEQLAAGENGNRVVILTGQMTTPKTDNIPCFPSESYEKTEFWIHTCSMLCTYSFQEYASNKWYFIFLFFILDDMIIIIIGLLTLMGHLLNLTMTTTKGGAVKYESMSLCLLTLEIKGNFVLMVTIVLWY